MKVCAELYRVRITEQAGYQSTKEDFAKAQAKFDGMDFVTRTEWDEEPAACNYLLVTVEELLLDREQLLAMSIRNIRFEVIQEIKVDIDITQQIIELAEKPIKIITESSKGDTYNHKCEVHMPGQGLSLYNEMLLLEDECMDSIQSHLNSGWRIVAACPQPEQRRPDFILGRFNPDLEVGGSAERG